MEFFEDYAGHAHVDDICKAIERVGYYYPSMVKLEEHKRSMRSEGWKYCGYNEYSENCIYAEYEKFGRTTIEYY